MAGIDVNDVLMDPMLSTTFSVRRRSEVVNSRGRTVITETVIDNVVGIITWEDGKIEREPDGTLAQQRLKIVTPFSLRDASLGFQPDYITWKGVEYLITWTHPNRHIGRGFTRATATSTKATDPPPVAGSEA